MKQWGVGGCQQRPCASRCRRVVTRVELLHHERVQLELQLRNIPLHPSCSSVSIVRRVDGADAE
jgi:hypothetical protein